jgi:hypothetical protein
MMRVAALASTGGTKQQRHSRLGNLPRRPLSTTALRLPQTTLSTLPSGSLSSILTVVTNRFYHACTNGSTEDGRYVV